MVVLFVCMGNTYRSRMAEAYLNSLKIPGMVVKSAGVHAALNLSGPISPYAIQVLIKHGLGNYAAKHWTQLSQDLLDEADVVIALNRQVYSSAKHQGYRWPLHKFIWDVPDINPTLPEFTGHPGRIPHVAFMTFRRIQIRVDEMLVLMHSPHGQEQVDIINPDGSPTGITASMEEVHQKGLWHRGIHAGLYTGNGKLVLAKRAKSIIGNPGLWDFSAGGGMGKGETPLAALRREVGEELGININNHHVTDLGIWRYNHYLPHYGLHTRVLVNTYIVKIDASPSFKLQESEVADVQLVGFNEARRLIRSGHDKLGDMIHMSAYYGRLLAAVEKVIEQPA